MIPMPFAGFVMLIRHRENWKPCGKNVEMQAWPLLHFVMQCHVKPVHILFLCIRILYVKNGKEHAYSICNAMW